MNYEKAYKEAIERAKELQKTTTGANYEYIFPELKESEDERVRKELIEFVSSRLAGFPRCERFCAWLEKQKPIEIDFKSLNDIKRACGIFGKNDIGEISNDTLDSIAEKYYKLGLNEQKPIEWSDEDEKMYDSALWHVRNSCGNGGKTSGEYTVYNWLKTLKQRITKE